MSQGVLQAIFEYQTAICELTGMDVSNASGYDGFTVAADACFIAKHVTGRSTRRACRDPEPAGARGREDAMRPVRARGRRGRRTTGGVTDPGAARRRGRGRSGRDLPAAELLRLPRGRAGARRGRAEAGALAVAHVDPTSLGVLEAPGAYGCDMAIGEGQGLGNALSYGGPHYGFLAARTEFVRRHARPHRRPDDRPRRRARLRADAADPRAAHPPREGDVEHDDQPDAARPRRPDHARLARSAGAARARRDLHGARRVRPRADRPAAGVRAAVLQGGRRSGRRDPPAR